MWSPSKQPQHSGLWEEVLLVPLVFSLVALQSSFFLLSVSLAEVLSHGGPQKKINLKQSLQGKLQSGEETGASGKAVC